MAPESTSGLEIDRIRRERDFYRRLLELGTKEEIAPFLDEALAMIVGIAGAQRGYLEVRDESGGDRPPRFWIARGCTDEDVEVIRATFSRGVIAAAIATGETIVTASALADPRFKERSSVRRNRIEAVLCAPIGLDPPFGVVYLQDRTEPGPFSEDDRHHAEVFARHLSALADRLLIRLRRRNELDPTQPFRKLLRLDGFVGRSAAIAKVLHQISLAAPLDVGVLLTGPSGTGKTQLARLIHMNSPRSAAPFVELNCAALPEALLESELFGALPGAHSTASRKVEGKVAAADGGTLFLDEVGELQLSAQVKLLQLLQSKEYYPLGGSRPVKANVRVIAATNTDLVAAVARREFREDLLYRLQVLPIRVPALFERREDIPELCGHFCARASEVHRLPQLSPSRGALRAAETAEWPGNVRQLGHAVEAAAIRAAGEGVAQIEREHLFPDCAGAGGSSGAAPTFQEATHRFQAELLRRVLLETGWNITEAANRLDLTRSHVYNLIKSFRLTRNGP
ncbi:sigma 54-interacting transcriptional regulator [Sorangium sp. So ce1078]|uniref:sigma 54-interacting transcriptional regulator n=1 Tax=Sorangium sp. So ce1078 TaxID=3133329 RepID=UPI003F5D6DAB